MLILLRSFYGSKFLTDIWELIGVGTWSQSQFIRLKPKTLFNFLKYKNKFHTEFQYLS